MRYTELHSYGDFSRLKSMASAEVSSNGIYGQVSVTKVTLQVRGHRLWGDSPGLFAQDLLRMNECLSRCQPRDVD